MLCFATLHVELNLILTNFICKIEGKKLIYRDTIDKRKTDVSVAIVHHLVIAVCISDIASTREAEILIIHEENALLIRLAIQFGAEEVSTSYISQIFNPR